MKTEKSVKNSNENWKFRKRTERFANDNQPRTERRERVIDSSEIYLEKFFGEVGEIHFHGHLNGLENTQHTTETNTIEKLTTNFEWQPTVERQRRKRRHIAQGIRLAPHIRLAFSIHTYTLTHIYIYTIEYTVRGANERSDCVCVCAECCAVSVEWKNRARSSIFVSYFWVLLTFLVRLLCTAPPAAFKVFVSECFGSTTLQRPIHKRTEHFNPLRRYQCVLRVFRSFQINVSLNDKTRNDDVFVLMITKFLRFFFS